MSSYGQKNYLQIQGRVSPSGVQPKYRIDQIGCLTTAFSNLLLRFGEALDPSAINGVLRDRKVYIDVDDGVYDDVGWQSITAVSAQVVVTATGNGRPTSNNSIVKFVYGGGKTHFCLVQDAAAGTIVDSWDGVVKSWSVYGGPVAWAAYANNTPQVVTPPPAPAPTPVAAAPVAPRDVNGKSLFLPSAAGTWRIYNLSGPYVVGKEIGKLAPANYPPGLTYPIEGTIATNIYKIKTQAFGEVAIYAGPDTIAQFVDTQVLPTAAPEQVASPTPEPTPAVVPVPESTALATPESDTTSPTPTGSAVTPAEKPAELDWRLTYKVNDAGKYVAVEDDIVKDIAGVNMDLTIKTGQKVTVAGSFEKDGQKYYRPASSAQKDTWYGIPVEVVKPVDQNKDTVGDELLKDLDMAIDAPIFKNLSAREKLIAVVAKAEGYLIRFVTTITFQNKNKNKGSK